MKINCALVRFIWRNLNMKHARMAFILAILIVTPYFISGIITPSTKKGVEISTLSKSLALDLPSLEVHDPIVIHNDTAFHTIAADEMWAGDGSPSTPYIIEGFNITSNTVGISIYNVTLSFEIRSCYIASPIPWTFIGIDIFNVSHVAIYDTMIEIKHRGMQLEDIDSLSIYNCTMRDIEDECIYILWTEGSTIDDCDIYSSYGTGIYIQDCNYTTISNTDISSLEMGSGIYTEDSYFVTILDNEISNCSDHGIWAYESDTITIEGNTIYNNHGGLIVVVMCGIFLDNSHDAYIVENQIFDNAQNGIYIYYSDWADVAGNDIYCNADHGIDVSHSTNGTIRENNIHSNGWWPIILNSLCGIFLGSGSDEWAIRNNQIWNNTPTGISLEVSDTVEIYNNHIYNNTDRAIRAYAYGTSEGLLIQENEIHGNGFDNPSGGIIIYGYENSTVKENLVYNNSGRGILSHGALNNITNNEVYDTIGYGIFIEQTNLNRIEDNIVHDNTESGIFVYSGYSDVIGNIVYDNAVGVHLYGSIWCSVYGNDIGWNDINALQELGQPNNEWYNGLSDYGNWWHDHVAPEGEGINRYPISNGTDTVTFDNYPETSLNLTSPNSISYEILETSNVLTWEAYALHPYRYSVFIDGEFAFSETWDGGDVELNVDGLADGLHEVMLAVFHISGHALSDDTNVTVSDLTPPSDILGPTLIEVAVGDPISTQYSSTDPSGFTWAVNDTANFAISSTGILSNIVDLQVGNYVVLIEAADPFGHTTYLIVTIAVSSSGLPTTLLLAIGGGGAIILLAIGVAVYKKRQT